MAAGDSGMFDQFFIDLANQEMDITTGGNTLKYGLVDNTFTPGADDATPRWAGTGGVDFSSAEVGTAGGYTGPVTILGQDFTDTGTGTMKFDFTDPVAIDQHASGATDIYWVIIYNDTHTTKNCIGWMDLGGPVSLVAGSLTWSPHANGFATWTVT